MSEHCGCECSPGRHNDGAISLGIYEKALRHTGDWDAFFADARDAGFSFVDLSVDESPERRERLTWPSAERRVLRDTARRYGIQIGGLCLSVHRAVGPGSADPAVRAEAARIFRDGIDLCQDLGIPVLQVAGYYAYYEQPDPDQRARYIETLAQAVPHAARAGVLLGIENVDGNDVTSISGAMEIVRDIDSPWLQLYPDIGNIAEQQLDTRDELRAGRGHMLALHVKDVLVGEPRRIPFGQGVADFPTAFDELARQQWSGRIMLEMWNDDAPDSAAISARSRELIAGWLRTAGLTISTHA
ncbi:L-ribulose-5-phosphate 3-epimerase [Devriesea agamarum]|uniref:L-ribulose-5-phosphate 3-epimerase n=1 Tax=Devriesea agamarum TaxID=472569 RepID=UPI00071CC478|nr:L-ribulose-5-phosphate 3-epimerase [Devriesea agamarum]